MQTMTAETLSLTSTWFIQVGCEPEAAQALQQLAEDVYENEADTLAYLIHTPFLQDSRLKSLPPVDPLLVLFFERYRSPEAFLAHLNGSVFGNFVKSYGKLFVAANGHPFTFVNFLQTTAGFVRTASDDRPRPGPGQTDAINAHPAVMFEIIAKDQPGLKDFYSKAFDWNYRIGSAGFAYIPFPQQTLAPLGGIGQADDSIPGMNPGHNFYLRVDDLDAAIARVLAAGGSRYVDPVSIDGYTFAMVKDPEDNPVGLLKAF